MIEDSDALLERFIETYAAARERSGRYWRQWTSALGDLPRQVVEGMAHDQAEVSGLPLEQVQARLAAEKIASDMGEDWVRGWLTEHDARTRARELQAQKSLQPLTLKRKKK
jgi:hypothetical protein